MTPLVDVAFLLLTFFMFATTMMQPHVMEMQAPPVDGPSNVRENNILTIYIRKDGTIFQRIGRQAMHPIAIQELMAFAVERNAERDNDLVTALRVDPRADYGAMIDVMDKLNLAESDLIEKYQRTGVGRERRFTIAPLEEQDKLELARQ